MHQLGADLRAELPWRTRVWHELCHFISRLVKNCRKEHTVVHFLAPPEDDEAITPDQIVHLFWTTLAVELMIICLQTTPPPDDRVGDGTRNKETVAAANEAIAMVCCACAVLFYTLRSKSHYLTSSVKLP